MDEKLEFGTFKILVVGFILKTVSDGGKPFLAPWGLLFGSGYSDNSQTCF